MSVTKAANDRRDFRPDRTPFIGAIPLRRESGNLRNLQQCAEAYAEVEPGAVGCFRYNFSLHGGPDRHPLLGESPIALFYLR